MVFFLETQPIDPVSSDPKLWRHVTINTKNSWLPGELPEVKRIIGCCKRRACQAIKHVRTGSTWSANGTYKRINDYEHQCNTFDYIRSKQGPGTFVWTYHNEEYWMLRGKRKTPFVERKIPQF